MDMAEIPARPEAMALASGGRRAGGAVGAVEAEEAPHLRVLDADLVRREAHEFVREDEPGVGLAKPVVRPERPAVAGGLVVEGREPQVADERGERLLHGRHGVAAVEDVVHHEHPLRGAEVVHHGAHVLDHGVLVLSDSGVGLRLERGVVARDAEVVEPFLDRHRDRGSPAPEADDDVRAEPGIENLARKGEAVARESVAVEVDFFVHGRNSITRAAPGLPFSRARRTRRRRRRGRRSRRRPRT